MGRLGSGRLEPLASDRCGLAGRSLAHFAAWQRGQEGAAVCPASQPAVQYDDDPAATRASTRKLVDLAQREGVKLLVLGHDGDQWANLKLLPEWYE